MCADIIALGSSRNDIHYTAQFSAPSPGGVTRLCADDNDKKVRDWFRDQVLALGADYKVRNPRKLDPVSTSKLHLLRGRQSQLIPCF